MNLKEKKELLKNVELLGKKAYKDLTISKIQAEGLLNYVDRAGLLTSKSIKIKNFIKYLESLVYTKKVATKKATEKKIEEEVAQQQIFNILAGAEIKEEVKKEEPRKVANKKRVAKKVTTKKVPTKKDTEKKEEVKKEVPTKKAPAKRAKAETKPIAKKEPSKKPLTEKEKQRLYKKNYRQEFIKALGNPIRRKQISNFIRSEITSNDLEKYFTVADFPINDIGLQMLHNRATFLLVSDYGAERASVIDVDNLDGRKYVLIKSLDSKNYDPIFLDTYNTETNAFTCTTQNGEKFQIKFYIPVLKKNVNIDY